LLAGYEEYANRAHQKHLLTRLEHQRLIERAGRGSQAVYWITPAGRERVSAMQLQPLWDEPWDGLWRVVTFDVPESRRNDRKRLWQALRARKLGLLQRSVWVWPRNVESILNEIIHAQGIPECFCGFEARRLFLCTDAEVVAAAWDFEEITRRHKAYLDHPVLTHRAVKNSRDLTRLAALARAERTAYEYAFVFDPLLPRLLLPKAYRGMDVQQRHEEFRQLMRQRLTALASG
jgi:phenylacetic acid degradation operon negative regulatory protein